MNTTMKLRTRAALASAALAAVLTLQGPAYAQDADAPGDWELSGTAGVYSQYRFRGISLSDEDLAVQGSIGLSHSSGFYVGTWGSNIAGYGTFGGSNVELDIYGGYAGEAGAFTYDVSLLWYLYPGTSGTDYAEIIGKVGTDLGPVGATFGIAYAPDQSSIGSEDNIYFFGDLAAGIPNTPVTLKAHLGYNDGDGTLSPTGSYLDWSLGADIAIDRLTLGIAYVDTDLSNIEALTTLDPTRNIADANLVVSLSISF